MSSILLTAFLSSAFPTFEQASSFAIHPGAILQGMATNFDILLGYWTVLTTVLLLYKALNVFVTHSIRRPVSGSEDVCYSLANLCILQKNLLIAGAPTLVGQWLSGLWSVVGTNFMVKKAYAKVYYHILCAIHCLTYRAQSGGKAFAIPTFANYQIYVSASKDIISLGNASPKDLAFNSALEDVSTDSYQDMV